MSINQYGVNGGNSVQAFQSVTAVNSVGDNTVDFRVILNRLFANSQGILKDYADPNVSELNIPGYSPVEKDSPGAALVVSTALTQIESQLNTILSGLEFTLKTMPQKIDNLFG